MAGPFWRLFPIVTPAKLFPASKLAPAGVHWRGSINLCESCYSSLPHHRLSDTPCLINCSVASAAAVGAARKGASGRRESGFSEIALHVAALAAMYDQVGGFGLPERPSVCVVGLVVRGLRDLPFPSLYTVLLWIPRATVGSRRVGSCGWDRHPGADSVREGRDDVSLAFGAVAFVNRREVSRSRSVEYICSGLCWRSLGKAARGNRAGKERPRLPSTI